MQKKETIHTKQQPRPNRDEWEYKPHNVNNNRFEVSISMFCFIVAASVLGVLVFIP